MESFKAPSLEICPWHIHRLWRFQRRVIEGFRESVNF